MIRLTSPNEYGSTVHYVSALAISSVTEAGASSQWHGVKSFVRTFDGRTLEIRETADEVKNGWTSDE